MKIRAKIQTVPALKVTFEIDGLKAFKTANDFAVALNDVDTLSVPLPKSLQRRLASAFKRAWKALPETERLAFCQPSQALEEIHKSNARELAKSKTEKLDLQKFKSK